MKISRKAKREVLLIVIILISLVLLYASIFGDGGYQKLRKQREALTQLQRENQKLRELQQTHLQKIDRIKNDPDEIERIARERYNFARPGDIILNLPQPAR
ncbi:MAG: septum formation initiator family protein [Acidobacteria bacterium]|nr:septum formation initiator family protein [Acidobacteriota bacterium]